MARVLMVSTVVAVLGASALGTDTARAIAAPASPTPLSSDTVSPVVELFTTTTAEGLDLPLGPTQAGEVVGVSFETLAPTPPEPALAPEPEPEPPPAPLSLRDRALGRFVELGAAPWQVAIFDCIGWRESRWSNVRSKTGDSGVLQINDVHSAQLRAQGLDAWVPEDAATYSWQLSRRGTNFTPWTVHASCGV